LVLYRDGVATWAAPGALGRGGDCALLQSDGNFVLYDGQHNPLWATGAWRKATRVKVQDDGNFCLYKSDGSAVWAALSIG
jgi:hypothetical protein